MNSDSISFEAFSILAIGFAAIIIISVVYQAYINIHQLRIECTFDSEVDELDITEQELSEKKELENKIAFFAICIVASLFDKTVEWNKDTNEILVRDNRADWKEYKK